MYLSMCIYVCATHTMYVESASEMYVHMVLLATDVFSILGFC
jgi:hypothetical protein